MNGSRSGLDADSNAESIAGVTTYATFSPATGASGFRYFSGTGFGSQSRAGRGATTLALATSAFPATGAYLTGTGRNATDSRSRSQSPTG